MRRCARRGGLLGQFHPGLAIEPILSIGKASAKPLAGFLTPHAERSLSLLAQRGIAAFRTPEACADAFAAYFFGASPRQPPDWRRCRCAQDAFELPQRSAFRRRAARSRMRRTTASDCVSGRGQAARREHKTEAGGVALDVTTDQRPRKGRLVGQEGRPGTENGARASPRRSLATATTRWSDRSILVGAGGTLAELYRDFSLALAPVTAEEAERMIGRVKGLGRRSAAIATCRAGTLGRSRGRSPIFRGSPSSRGGRSRKPRSIRSSSRRTAWSRSTRAWC